ncbi:MAG: hypothetical protein RR497_03840 [Oscillospiraceae bacterium]
MNNFKKITAMSLVAVIAASFTACSNPKWAFQAGDFEVTSGVYIGYTLSAYTTASQHKDYNKEEKDMFKQTLDGKSASDYIKEEATKYSKNYLAINSKFKELNLEFIDKDINVINTNVKSAWEKAGKMYEKNGVSKASYQKIVESQRKNELIFKSIFGKDGTKAISDDDLLIHFKENYASINVFSIPIKTGDKITDADKANNEVLKTKAEEYVKNINDGHKFNVVKDYYTHYIEKTEHKDTDDEHMKTIKDDKDTKTLIGKNDTQIPEKIKTSIFEAKVDQATLISDEQGYYVIYRYDVTKDKTQFDGMRDGLLYDLKGEDYEKMLEEFVTALDVKTNDAAIKKFKPKNIVFK